MRLLIALSLTLSLALADLAAAQSLRGSTASMRRQNQAAHHYDYTFLKTSRQVNEFVEHGYLTRVHESAAMEIHNVSYPYARPEVKLLLERLSRQYRNACGEKLTVTSLTRPINRQPSNASSHSVHPTGMAIDLRVPAGTCRRWLENTLLYLEGAGTLDVTRERYPPHYHVAVFTREYEAYVANITSEGDIVTPTQTVATASMPTEPIAQAVEMKPPGIKEYTVRRGDTLAAIAERFNTSISRLRMANGISGDIIRIDQSLRIPLTEQNQLASISNIAHEVRRGETLWSIASLYGLTVGRIKAENAIASSVLQIGQTLRISFSTASN